MAKDTTDANTEVESSTPPDATASRDDKDTTQGSSPSGNEAPSQNEESLATVVEKAAEESLSREEAANGNAEKISKTEEEGEKSDEEKAPSSESETQKDDEVPKEFHEHPAWKRIIGERNEARDKVSQLETSAKAHESLLSYCRERNITDEQFRDALEVVTLINSDPTKAYEKLRPIVEALETHTGKRLPEDLEKKVSEGVLDPETAQEVARLRAEKQFGAVRQQTAEQQQRQQAVASMVQSLNDWDGNKRKTDPDFDKKAELVKGAFLALYQATDAQGRPINPIRTAQDAVALAEKAYADVNGKLSQFIPKKTEKRVLTHAGAGTSNTEKQPANLREAVAMELRRKHGFSLED